MGKRGICETASTPTKRKKYDCKFNIEWTRKFSGIAKGSNDGLAFCKFCNSTFSVKRGGVNDVSRHVETPGHMTRASEFQTIPKLSTMFASKDPLRDQVTHAEVLFTHFVAEHNLAFSVADHFTKLCKKMFPDSEIAKKFSCQRTKTTHIINQALAPTQSRRVADLCKKNKFSIMVDESNDNGNDKCVAILVRVLDRSVHRIATRFLAMPICNIGTGANLFSCIEQVLLDLDIKWSECIGYGSDNASVMVGRHNSVLSRIRDRQPNVYDMGCLCHIANTCVQYGMKKLPIPVEDLLIDVYYHFQHSSKRKEEYAEFLSFTEVEQAKILKHCSTRWLSLEKCVHRLLQQWPALVSYFNSHTDADKSGSRIQRCATRLSDPLFQLTYHFLAFIMGPLNQFNTTFQADESMIGCVRSEMVQLLRKFLGKFVQTKIILSSSDITTVEYNKPENQHSNDLLAVGMGTRKYIYENPDIPTEKLKRFFCGVRNFYTEVTEKMIKKFPFNDKTLQQLGFVNPAFRVEADPESIVTLGRRFQVAFDEENLREEITDYQLSPDIELPQYSNNIDEEKIRLDSFWLSMEKVKTTSNKLRFGDLSTVALTVLSLPHSNADVERCFSMLRKCRTDYRHNLTNNTLNSLLNVKLNIDDECYSMSVSEEMAKDAKRACMSYQEKKD